nr:LysE family transporter [Marinobacter salexigens]
MATSALAFSVVKLLGATYLIFLGIQAWRSQSKPSPVSGYRQSHRACVYRSWFKPASGEIEAGVLVA